MAGRGSWLLAAACMAAGCTRSAQPKAPAVTFCRDVAPLLAARCAPCHRPGEAAPFSLLSYDDARGRARQIADVVRRRFMPPWLPEPGGIPFANDRRLRDEEIAALVAWADAGAPQGDPRDLPPPPAFTPGWQLGPPDLVIDSPAWQLPAGGGDRFRNFVLPVPPGPARWVAAVELRPENPRATHHARLGLDASQESTRRDAADPDPGYEGMAWGEDPPGELITWTPGMSASRGTPGAAWRLVPHVPLVLHAHLQPTGKPEQVRFRVGLHLTEQPPTVRPVVLRIGSRAIDIAAGDADHRTRDAYRLPIDVELRALFPHAHRLCRTVRVTARDPAGVERTLLDIRRFDEKWHDNYALAVPQRLARGTQLVAEFAYDNSAANVRNPHHPPRRVAWGSNADDEMGDVFIQVTPARPEQRAVLAEHYNQFELRSKIVGYRAALELHGDDAWNIEALAACLLSTGDAPAAEALLSERAAAVADSPQARLIQGMAQLAAGRAQEAEATLRAATQADAQSPHAWWGLGQSLAAQRRSADACDALDRAVRLAPHLATAQLDLADALAALGRLDEALAAVDAAAEAAPDSHAPNLKRGNLLAQAGRRDASLAAFAQAQGKAPFVYAPEASLAIALYQRGDEADAKALLADAARIDRDPVPQFFLGQIARRDGDFDAARQRLDRAAVLPLPDVWPASHVRQFLTLLYAEQLQLAEQLQDAELARRALDAWQALDPRNEMLRAQRAVLDASGQQPPADSR